MQLTKTHLSTTDTYIKKLNSWWINSIQDMIFHFPRDLEDKTNEINLFVYASIKEKNSIICTIENISSERTRNNKILVKAIIKDSNNILSEAVWFNRKFLLNQFKQWDKIRLYWKPKYAYWKLSFPSPEIEKYSENIATLNPIYSDVNYISWTWISRKMVLLKRFCTKDFLPEILPKNIISQNNFQEYHKAIYNLHFPDSINTFKKARYQLAYTELFLYQKIWFEKKLLNKKESSNKSYKHSIDLDFVKTFLKSLPFELTNEQKIVTFQILKDFDKDYAMHRLLQWDVWTGKTIVAIITAFHIIHKLKSQVAIMAPTEILARQHFEEISELAMKYNVKVDLIVWSLTPKQKREARARLETWETDLVIWTHALVQEWLKFKNLSYVVIDEQHRFWVNQRKILEECNIDWKIPHSLNMTATPIPRTLAITLHWDQDISIIREYPKWRKIIHTAVVKDSGREHIYRFIEEELNKWRQVYWVSPLVEESESEKMTEVASARTVYWILLDIFPHRQVWLLHWKIKAKEKESIMRDFYDKKIDILSATSVVEVWVNNPNATIMCIEWAERFGLSQLHQFRWRVWRWEHQSYCYLFTTHGNSTDRLKAMEETNDWFKLSQADLDLRWPWEIYWLKQSWLPDFKLASLQDMELLSIIQADLEEIYG